MLLTSLPISQEDYPEFKKEFWNWFDNELRPLQKKNLQKQPVDVAEHVFYEKVWRHRND